MSELPDPFELLKKILPPMPFQTPEAAAGPPDLFELLKKIFPLGEFPFPKTEMFGAASIQDESLEKFDSGAVSVQDEELEKF